MSTDKLYIYTLPQFEIFVESSLHFYVRVCGWMLTDDHELYKKYERSFANSTLSDFIQDIEQYILCEGVTIPDPKISANIQKHVIPKTFSFLEFLNQPMSRVHQDEFSRSMDCLLLINNNKSCLKCSRYSANLSYEKNRKDIRLKEPAKLNAPIKFTSPERIKLTLQAQRLKCKQQEELIKEINLSLQNRSRPIDSELNKDFLTLFSGCDQESVPPIYEIILG